MPELSNIQYAPEDVPAIGAGMGFAAQACADGMYQVGVYVYTANNLEGRYRQGGEFDNSRVSGNRQWAQPWGDYQGLMTSTNVPIQQYCAKYGITWDELLSPFVLNQHRNGLLKTPDRLRGMELLPPVRPVSADHRGLRQRQAHILPAEDLGLRPARQLGGRFRVRNSRTEPGT